MMESAALTCHPRLLAVDSIEHGQLPAQPLGALLPQLRLVGRRLPLLRRPAAAAAAGL